MRSECTRKSAEYTNSVLRCFRWNAADSRRGVASWSSGMGRCQCEGQRSEPGFLGPRPWPASDTSVSPANRAWLRQSPTFCPEPFRGLPPASPADTLVAPPESRRSPSDQAIEGLGGDCRMSPGASRRLGRVTLFHRNSEEIPAKVPKPQRVTRLTWGPRRGSNGLPPDQRRRGWRATGRGRQPMVAPQVLQLQIVTRFSAKRYRLRSVALARTQRRRRGAKSSRVLRVRLA